MRKIGLVIGLLWISVMNSFGQDGGFPASKTGTGTIYGKIMDGTKNEALAYANVSLLKKGSPSIIASKTTESGGRFIFRDLPYGKYFIEVSFLGMNDYASDKIVVDKNHSVVPLGQIVLTANTEKLTEVKVQGERVAEEISLIKKVFNVSQDVNTAGGTALDALRNIPALSVSMDGNVQLRGSSNVKILVNGRSSSLIGSGGEQNLEQIPSASIETIEVLTNPSAKYEAAGKTGIINIILKKAGNLGFNYSLNVLAGTKDKLSTGLAMNYRTEKWNWRVGYQFDRKFYPSWKTLDRQSIFADTTYFLSENSTADKLKQGHTLSFGIDWTPAKKTSVFTTITANPHFGQKESVYNYTYYNQEHLYDSNSQRTTQDDEASAGLQAEIGLNKKFSRKGMSWKTVYTYDVGTKADSVLSAQDYYYEQDLLDTKNEKNRRDQLIQTQRFQSDFTYPLTHQTKLETGIMYSARSLDNDFRYFDKDGANWIPNASRTNDFEYSENIAAAYLMGTTRKDSWEFNLGLRVENTDANSKLANATEQYPNQYTNLFPSGHLAVDVLPKGKGSIQLSYSRRIHRPSYRRLNPFASYNDNENIHRGNPLLKPELTDSWEIGWQSRWKKGSINPAVFYRKTYDKIGYYTHLLPNKIRELTFVNLNSQTAQGAEINGSYNPVSWFRLSGNISYFYVEKDGENLENKTSNQGNMLMSRLMATFKPTKALAIQLSSFYHSGFVGTVGNSKPMKDMDLGMTYRAFKNRGKFIFRVSDVFDTRRFAMHVATSDLLMDFERKRDSRIFWLGFNWELKQDKAPKRKSGKHKGGGDIEF